MDGFAHAEHSFKHWRRDTALFLSGQIVSLFGSSIVQLAIIWHITLSTHSGLMMALASVCGFLPQILISPFAGVWADRCSRKRMIILSDTLTAAFTAALALLWLSGVQRLSLILTVSAVRSLGAGIQAPAVSALLPQLVPREKLMRINGLNGGMQSLIMLLSPAVSGALMSLIPLGAVFFVDVVTAAAAVGILLALPVARAAASERRAGYLDDVRAGLRYAKSSGFIVKLLLFYAVFFFLLVPTAYMTPLLIARSFGGEVWRLTANEMLYSLGSILGGMLIYAWSGFRNRVATISLSCAMFGLCAALLGVCRPFGVYLAAVGAVGLFMPFFTTTLTTLFQERVAPEMHGRIFGLLQIVSTAAMPLGMAIFGPLADHVPVESILIVTGLIAVCLGSSLYFDRALRAAGEPLPAGPKSAAD